MRRLILPFYFLPVLAVAQPLPKALLWQIGGNGLEKPSYVVGTVHSRDARAYGQADRLVAIIAEQDVVAGELDLSAAGAGSMQLVMRMMMPPDTVLADLYTKRRHKRVKKAVAGQLGPLAMMADRIKPFFLMGLLNEAGMHADSAMVLDQYLQVKAREMGKEVTGVETVEEQLAAVDHLSLQQQADMLYATVRKGGQQKELDRLMEAYAGQDLEQLYAMSKQSDLPEALSTSLLTRRNQVMTSRMDGLMRDGRTFLFAVGAMHLPGEDGVLRLLEGAGYTVTPEP